MRLLPVRRSFGLPIDLAVNWTKTNAANLCPIGWKKALSQLPAEALWRYPDRRDLEAKIADKFGLDDAMVLVGNGGDELIQYVYADLPADTPVIAPLPTFGFYQEQGDIWPVRSIYLEPKQDLSLDIEACCQAIDANPNGLFILIRPNNPTGEMVSRQVALDLLDRCARNNTVMLLDEAYAEFADDDLLDQLANYENLIVLRTFSKAYGLAGLRMGYFLADAARLNRLRRRVMPYNVSAVSLHLGQSALGLEAEREVRTYCERVRQNRQKLYELLTGWGIRVLPSQANFLTMQLGEYRAEFVGQVLASRGFAVRTFKRAYITGCVRFSIPAETQAFEEALALALKPELICLDVDGTLIDVRESFDTAVLETVSHFCGESPDRAEILQLRAGGGFNDDFLVSTELIRQRGVEVPLEDVKQVFQSIYFGTEGRAGAVTREQPLVSAALWQTWKERAASGEVALALVTGRNREEMAPGLALLDIPADWPCYTIDDVAEGKPDPEGILSAADETQARRIWMVGDNLDDVRAALAAGAVAIGVGENRAALVEAGACAFLDEIDQLEELL